MMVFYSTFLRYCNFGVVAFICAGSLAFADEIEVSGCSLMYAHTSNQDAIKILTKKFDFTDIEASILLANPKFNHAILDLLLAQSELLNGQKGEFFEELSRTMKKSDYHELNSKDEEFAMMLALPAADLWPVNLTAIVAKTKLISAVLQKKGLTISRPSFELLVSIVSQYNFLEKYRPAKSESSINDFRRNLYKSMSEKELLRYLAEMIAAFPKAFFMGVKVIKEKHVELLNSMKNQRKMKVGDASSPIAVKTKRRILDLLECASQLEIEVDPKKILLLTRKLLDLNTVKAGDQNNDYFIPFTLSVDRFFIYEDENVTPQTWQYWSKYYKDVIKKENLTLIATENAPIPDYFFEVEENFFLQHVRPTEVSLISSKLIKQRLQDTIRKKLAEFKSIAKFEIIFSELAQKEELSAPINRDASEPAELQLSLGQFRYLIPENNSSSFSPELIAKNAEEMKRLIVQYAASQKIGAEIADHFLIRDEKYRRIFLKSFIGLIEGSGSLIPLGTKQLQTKEDSVFEFNRLGSYRLFFGFNNNRVVLLLIDNVKNGATLQGQQRAIDLALSRLKDYRLDDGLR